MTTNEAATYLGVVPMTVLKWLKNGQLKGTKPETGRGRFAGTDGPAQWSVNRNSIEALKRRIDAGEMVFQKRRKDNRLEALNLYEKTRNYSEVGRAMGISRAAAHKKVKAAQRHLSKQGLRETIAAATGLSVQKVEEGDGFVMVKIRKPAA